MDTGLNRVNIRTIGTKIMEARPDTFIHSYRPKNTRLSRDWTQLFYTQHPGNNLHIANGSRVTVNDLYDRKMDSYMLYGTHITDVLSHSCYGWIDNIRVSKLNEAGLLTIDHVHMGVHLHCP